MSLSDKELINGLQAGNESAFDLLFKTYYPALCSYANSYLRSADHADEIVQEVFVKLWEKHGKIHIHTSLRAYLYQSVFNGCMNYLREKQTAAPKHVDLDDLSIRNELMSLEMADGEFSGFLSEEAEKDLESAIGELPDQCREIFMMCRSDNLSYKEISNLLKVSKSTVKTQMSRAMNRLMKQMEKYF
jgi:RNA polymerase sigma-70 factor, ECF subfamily